MAPNALACRKCGQLTESKVIDSRSAKDGAYIRRRRECLRCGVRFTTYEQKAVERTYVVVGRPKPLEDSRT